MCWFSFITFRLSVNDSFSTSLLLFISFNCVQTSRVKYFLEFCLCLQVGFKSFVPFSKFQHIMSFQAPSLSNGGLGGTAVAMSRAQEELWNKSRSMPAECGDASVFFTWSLVPTAQSEKNERYTNMSGFQERPQKKKKKKKHCVIASREWSPKIQRSSRGKAHASPCDCLMVYFSKCLLHCSFFLGKNMCLLVTVKNKVALLGKWAFQKQI